MGFWKANDRRTVRKGAARLIGASLVMGLAALSLAADPQVGTRTLAVRNSAQLGAQVPLDTSTPISFAVVFNIDTAGLKSFVEQVSNPSSPLYRQFIGPDQIGQEFGASQADVDATVAFLQSKGFTITRVAKAHTAVFATGTVQQIHDAFQTTLVGIQRPDGSVFHTPLKPVTLPDFLVGKVHSIRGLDNSRQKRMRYTTTQLNPTLYRGAYNSDVSYAGGYYGQGTNVAIVNEDGFRTDNLPLFYAEYGLPLPTGVATYPLPASATSYPWPTPSSSQMLTNVKVRTIDGGSGTGYPQGEGDLDQQNVLQTAPLCNLYVYDDSQNDGSAPLSIYTAISDDNIADIVTESYGWATYGYNIRFTWNASTKTVSNLTVTAGQYYGTEATEDNTERMVLSAQGVTQLAASGDSGTLTEIHPINAQTIPAAFIKELQSELVGYGSGVYRDTGYATTYPNIDPEVLSVGGSEMTVAVKGSTVARNGEASWGLSGGVGGTGGFDIYDSPTFDSPTGQGYEPYIGYDAPGDQFPFNVAPSYQKTYVTKYSGPYNYRLFPDVASAAGGEDGLGSGSGTYPYPGWAYEIFLNRPASGGNSAIPIGFQAIVDGTSCASPAIAGSLAVVEERLFLNTTPNPTRSNVRLGRIANTLYGIAATNAFNDIHNGNTVGDIPGVVLASGTSSSITQNGYGITVNTASALSQAPVVGHSVVISGAVPASLNGTYVVASINSSTSFNLQSPTSQTATATTQGTIQLLLGAFPGVGWDFATGLGSMNFTNLYQVLLGLGK